MTQTIKTEGGSVQLNQLDDGSVAVIVAGAMNVDHAISVASDVVTHEGLDGEWENEKGLVSYRDLSDFLLGHEKDTTCYRFRLLAIEDDELCDMGPVPQ